MNAPQLQFLRRLGPDPHLNGQQTAACNGCPDVWELENGDIAVIGIRITDAVKGVVIAGITAGSDAATNGLQRGDIILQINQRPTVTPAEAAAAVDLARKAGRDTVLLLVQRGALPPRYVGIKLNTDKK